MMHHPIGYEIDLSTLETPQTIVFEVTPGLENRYTAGFDFTMNEDIAPRAGPSACTVDSQKLNWIEEENLQVDISGLGIAGLDVSREYNCGPGHGFIGRFFETKEAFEKIRVVYHIQTQPPPYISSLTANMDIIEYSEVGFFGESKITASMINTYGSLLIYGFVVLIINFIKKMRKKNKK